MAKKPKRYNKRISSIYKLGKTQGSLDFVDVDVTKDIALFISPTAISKLDTDFGRACASLVQSFFANVLHAIRKGEKKRALSLLGELKEPNEIHLGLSTNNSRGRSLNTTGANDIWSNFSNSEAAKTGLVTDLEDSALLIKGISVDIISDMTANIIRSELIKYTQEQCKQLGIPLVDGVASGPMWNQVKKSWEEKYVSLPVYNGEKIIFVPKSIVRRDLCYNLGTYYNVYLLTRLQQEEFKSVTGLVRLAQDGTRLPAYKKDIKEKYGTGKDVVIEQTANFPDVIQQYKEDQKKKPFPTLDHDQVSSASDEAEVNFDALLEDLLKCKAGRDDAKDYEMAVEALLTALFYPSLANPRYQDRLHEGRKIVDIVYDNISNAGFFSWLSKHHNSSMVYVECKNYDGKVSNPELDQLAGRFSPQRGKLGILVARKFDDKAKFMQKCKDTSKDDRGYIVPLDDDDLKALVAYRKSNPEYWNWDLLWGRFRDLVN